MASRSGLIALATAVAVAAAGSAQAACVLSIEPSHDEWRIRFDPFADDAAQRQFDVALVNRGDSSCEGDASFNLRSDPFGLTKAGETERLNYVLVDEDGGVDVTPRTGRSAHRLNARSINIAAGERKLMRYSFAAAANALLSSGLYSQNAFISVETADGAPLAERPVTLAVSVTPTAVMGLKGEFQRSNGGARIDLGELTSGSRSLNTSLYVMSTGGYSVSVQSANHGRLRLGLSDWYLDYSLGVGDRTMDLAQGGSIQVVSNRSRYDDYALSVKLGNTQTLRAGQYSDVITFTIAAL